MASIASNKYSSTTVRDDEELKSTENNSDLNRFHTTCNTQKTVGGLSYSTTGADCAQASGVNRSGICSPMTPSLSEVLTAAAKQDKDYVGYGVSLPMSGNAVHPSDLPGCRPLVATPLMGWQLLADKTRYLYTHACSLSLLDCWI